MTYYSYSVPQAPDYKKPTRIEDCLSQAKMMVLKETPETKRVYSVTPRFLVKDDDVMLMVTVPDQDNFVAEAITRELKGKGAKKVDFISAEKLLGQKCEKYSIEDGWRETLLMNEGKASGTDIDLLTGLGVVEAAGKYLTDHPEYTKVFVDVAGGNARRGLGDQKNKFGGFWPFNNWEWYLSKANAFPMELLLELENRIIAPIDKASAVRMTDPEGTYLEWSMTPEGAKMWQMYAGLIPGHLLMEPLMSTSGEVRALAGDSVEAPPVFSEVNGVLAGTSNHCGMFPRIEVYFEKGRLIEVKGGGKYGDGIRDIVDRFRNIQWPGYPDKGIFWFCDCALCTSVGAFRRKSDMFNSYWVYPNLPERTRAGVFHSGFGSRTYRYEKEFTEYSNKYKIPRGHIHVHNYFVTYEVKIRGTNYWHKVVDKGYLTALADPDFRAIATKYGNPDDLLTYDWIPPLPGINCEGDYLRDYAPDPMAYLKQRIKENKSI